MLDLTGLRDENCHDEDLTGLGAVAALNRQTQANQLTLGKKPSIVNANF